MSQSEKEELDIRISEIKKEAYEFRRDIVSGSVNTRTGTIIAEKVVRYFEEKIMQKVNSSSSDSLKESLIEKLKVKNRTLKIQCQKIESQLQQKEEMGEVFLPIDFDQLKIENKQYLEKIDNLNKELFDLKVTAGNSVRLLANLKVIFSFLNNGVSVDCILSLKNMNNYWVKSKSNKTIYLA